MVLPAQDNKVTYGVAFPPVIGLHHRAKLVNFKFFGGFYAVAVLAFTDQCLNPVLRFQG